MNKINEIEGEGIDEENEEEEIKIFHLITQEIEYFQNFRILGKKSEDYSLPNKTSKIESKKKVFKFIMPSSTANILTLKETFNWDR